MLYVVIVFAITLILAVPIPFVLGLMGVTHLLSFGNSAYPIVAIQRMYAGVDQVALTAIPFFIIAGDLMNAGGVTKRLLDFVREVIGWVRGGLAYSTVAIAAILSAILGSPNGVASMLCSVMIPELRKDGYPDEFSGSLIAAAAVLGPIIPPSTIFVLFSMLTDVSIRAMFMGGIIPGLLIAVSYCVIIFFKSKQYGFKKTIEKANAKRLLKSFVFALPALIVPVIMVGGIISGVFTATESGAVACVAALVAGIIYRDLDFKKIPAMLLRSSVVTASIFVIIGFGNVISWTMAISGIPGIITSAVLSFTQSPFVIILLMLLMLIVIGCVMDMTAGFLVFCPVMFPLAQAIGMDPVHFGVVFSIMLIIGLVTPPVGMLLFVTSNISHIPFAKLCKSIWPFALAAFVATFIMAYVPPLVTAIPRALGM